MSHWSKSLPEVGGNIATMADAIEQAREMIVKAEKEIERLNGFIAKLESEIETAATGLWTSEEINAAKESTNA